MGALHPGHASLIELAAQTCEEVVVSIFVNPTQFNNREDFETYPLTMDKDLEKLRSMRCNGGFCAPCGGAVWR